MADSICVAPREIVDAAFRAARVLGCEASVADRIAVDIEHCEVHHACGLREFWRLVDHDSDEMRRAAAQAIVPNEHTPSLFRRRVMHQPTDDSAEIVRRALAFGVHVDTVMWSRLVDLAAGFLLSESVLDAAATT